MTQLLILRVTVKVNNALILVIELDRLCNWSLALKYYSKQKSLYVPVVMLFMREAYDGLV